MRRAGILCAALAAALARGWSEPGEARRRDVLELTATNLSRLRVHPRRAKLSCRADLEVQTDGPSQVKLAGCARRERFG